ncbi:ANTAR domain-containing protein [Streptomyces sp. NPDC060000]|uniref:ANTAR domain-containing protein n=1 Tax=Streptomyces sp. NPDC060000 TaxID=3347031 RepID=UPI0036ABBE6A
MTTSREQRPQADGTRDATVTRLEHENAQLRHAVDSHAAIDQAIGVLIATHRLPPAAGFDVLREISQRTNTKMRTVAEALIAWALGRPLAEPLGQELDPAVQRRKPHTQAMDRPK